jgi:hypothetical protein
MPTGKDALGYPCGADFVNHTGLRTSCAARKSCSFVPESDKLDVVVADMTHNISNKTTETPSFPMADHIVFDIVSD